jgi:hypothetical protein
VDLLKQQLAQALPDDIVTLKKVVKELEIIHQNYINFAEEKHFDPKNGRFVDL